MLTLISFLLSTVTALADGGDNDTLPPPKERKGLIGKLLDYLDESNEEKPAKKLDISFIGGPHYASDTKLGIGLVAAGSYKTNLADSLTPRSDIALTADVSTVGFYMLGMRGTHRARADRLRLSYDFRFYSFPTYYWGIGYGNASMGDLHRSKYLEFSFGGNARLLGQVAKGLYIGPAFGFKWLRAKNPRIPQLWEPRQRFKTVCLGLGLSLRYDTRDNLTAPTRGWNIALEQRLYPRFMASPFSFSTTEVEAAFYRGVWAGGVVAARGHAMFCYGNVPWSMMATFGGSNTMRGYYEGRFRDYDEADLTLELRQNIKGRSGVAAWVAAASVFPRLSAFDLSHILPEAGLGYRWEFKRHCNVRLDYGLGRHSSGFVFSINEAF
ncbi:MAG: BamA/TamA family outer membrane protein [Pseudoflavonifractor sp.]|nr:BamA/TamA family outer membrane protein [Pseudoflavonifractor sp.]